MRTPDPLLRLMSDTRERERAGTAPGPETIQCPPFCEADITKLTPHRGSHARTCVNQPRAFLVGITSKFSGLGTGAVSYIAGEEGTCCLAACFKTVEDSPLTTMEPQKRMHTS